MFFNVPIFMIPGNVDEAIMRQVEDIQKEVVIVYSFSKRSTHCLYCFQSEQNFCYLVDVCYNWLS